MQKVYRDAPLAAPPVTIPFVVFTSAEDNAVVAFTPRIISADGPQEAMGPVAARYSAALEPVEWVWHPVNPAADRVEYVRGTAVLLRLSPGQGRMLGGAARAVADALKGTDGYEVLLLEL